MFRPANQKPSLDTPHLSAPQHFINRELSLLEFNERVLAQAWDVTVPLLERLRFLCISSSNLDEFFEIRVAGIRELIERHASQRGPDGMGSEEQLAAIHSRATRLVADQYRCLEEALLPAMRAAGIRIAARSEWRGETHAMLAARFEREVEPVLSPLALDPARPFPKIQNKSLNFIVRIEGQDAFGREANLAIVQAPRSLPRVLPIDDGQPGQCFVLLSALVHEFVPKLFEGMRVAGCYPFRVTRNSDLFVDEEEVDDLRRALEGELAQRRYGDEVRLETSLDCPDEIVDFLLRQFSLTRMDLYRVPAMVNLHRLSAVYDLAQRSDLKYPPFSPGVPKRILGNPDLFAALRQKDILLHHPFQSFHPVMDLLRQAASDPDVLAIKQTLYRTGANSPIVEALVQAAHAGKDVTVVIELRARFDEEANIELSNRLQEAGAHVMYGVVGFKTHAKLALIVRREADGLRRYCHLGTGNYHPRTARAYTDYSLMTADPHIGHDVHEIFLQLTSLTQTPRLARLLQSPFALHAAMLEKLDREAEHAIAGRPARVILKMNSLVEPRAIEALYRASRAGVPIDLIIRGVCALRPGIPGVSENIRVHSIIGRFLEHSRVFYFENGGDGELYCSSADWMGRNFFRRVEVAFPVLRASHRARILRDLETYLWDNVQSWSLAADGSYSRNEPGNEPLVIAQQELLETYAQRASDVE
jgi:polyphosphate kinase